MKLFHVRGSEYTRLASRGRDVEQPSGTWRWRVTESTISRRLVGASRPRPPAHRCSLVGHGTLSRAVAHGRMTGQSSGGQGSAADRSLADADCAIRPALRDGRRPWFRSCEFWWRVG
jgi:hypothetical protein